MSSVSNNSIPNQVIERANNFVKKYRDNPITHNAKFEKVTLLPAWTTLTKLMDMPSLNQMQFIIQSLWSNTVLAVPAAYSCWKSIGTIRATSPEKTYIQSEINSLEALKEGSESSKEIQDPTLKKKFIHMISKQLIALKHMEKNVSGTRALSYLNIGANVTVAVAGVMGAAPVLLGSAASSLIIGWLQYVREDQFQKVDDVMEDEIANLETAISDFQSSLPKADPNQVSGASPAIEAESVQKTAD